VQKQVSQRQRDWDQVDGEKQAADSTDNVKHRFTIILHALLLKLLNPVIPLPSYAVFNASK